MEPSIRSISSDSCNVRQEVFPLEQWTITTRKGIIMQSKCTCKKSDSNDNLAKEHQAGDSDQLSGELCNICRYYKQLPKLNNMPDMLFNENLLKLEHFTGIGIDFNALDALKCVEETKDPLKVAVADGWQSARADFPFAKSIVKPFDWTFTTDYRGTLLEGIRRARQFPGGNSRLSSGGSVTHGSQIATTLTDSGDGEKTANSTDQRLNVEENRHQTAEKGEQLSLTVEETDERIDVNKLKVREEILFYDDVTLFEDELADHGTAQYSVKVRVMPRSLFILGRFYLRVDGVLARINDTRIYHELNKKYLLREYTNREAKLSSINSLPVSTVTNPNELMNHLPIIQSRYEKLSLPKIR